MKVLCCWNLFSAGAILWAAALSNVVECCVGRGIQTTTRVPYYIVKSRAQRRHSFINVDATRRVFKLRGGSSPTWRQPAPTGYRRTMGQPQSTPLGFQQNQEQAQEQSKTAEQTKEMIDAFLTRESRNSFIGTYIALSTWMRV